MDPLLTLSGLELARKIKNRETSSEQVVTSHITHLRKVNPDLNAIVADRFDAALEEARREGQKVEIEYYTSYRDVMSTRIVHPYGFVEDEGNWYLIAFCETRKCQLSFRVDRVKNLRVLEDRFDLPAKLDLRAFKRPSKRGMDAGIPVTVRFAPYMADWAQERFPSKNLRVLKDGRTEFRFKTPATEWVVRWALELGGAMEVVEPVSVRGRVISTAVGSA